ncbi:DUF4834 domain-containing protein [Ekhidna sp.]|uniref:DUF4834 domain-containing protein n=1 Tax=Ekhidna sp. TaxID=2608089 RepID=UPI00329A3CD3
MLKIIIILILIGYVFYRVTSFIFSGMFRGFTRDQQFGNQRYSGSSKRAPNSNVNIDNFPNRSKKGDKFGGGEYVDYEEIK